MTHDHDDHDHDDGDHDQDDDDHDRDDHDHHHDDRNRDDHDHENCLFWGFVSRSLRERRIIEPFTRAKGTVYGIWPHAEYFIMEEEAPRLPNINAATLVHHSCIWDPGYAGFPSLTG